MKTALLVIDMQIGMADRIAARRPSANPRAQDNTAALIAHFRAHNLPVIHVHHNDTDPASDFHTGGPGTPPLPCAVPRADEVVLIKSGSSAFSGTGLDIHLRRAGIGRLVLIGAVAGYCVTSSTRAAADLGFEVVLPGDALISFDVPAHDGGTLTSNEVLRTTLSLLGTDFARITTSEAVLNDQP
jgi:nicotinamidase-related amidase